MLNWLTVMILIFSCSHDSDIKVQDNSLRLKSTSVALPPSFEKAQSLLLKMNKAEKYQILQSYLNLRDLSKGQSYSASTFNQFFEGIPRLKIPSIQFVAEDPFKDKVSTQNAAPLKGESEVLKLGTVNLIRNFEKAQVFESFNEAPKVDNLLSPAGQAPEAPEGPKKKLQDLDIFMVKSGSEESAVKDYICAIRKDLSREYNCVESRFDDSLQDMGLEENITQSFRSQKLTTSQVDSLVLRMLATMIELKIIIT